MNSESRCLEQNIPFFRFSPSLNEIIPAGETDNEKLFSMVLQTKVEINNQQMIELIKLFHKIAEASHAPIFNSIPEENPIEEEEEEVLDAEVTNPPPTVVISHSDLDKEESPSLEQEQPATSSPDLHKQHKNINLSRVIHHDPPLEQSVSALSDIQEESFHQSLSFSQASSDVLEATSLVQQSSNSPTHTQTEVDQTSDVYVRPEQREDSVPKSDEELISTLEESAASEDTPLDQQGNSFQDSTAAPALISCEDTPLSSETTPVVEPTNQNQVTEVIASLTADENDPIPTESKLADNGKPDEPESHQLGVPDEPSTCNQPVEPVELDQPEPEEPVEPVKPVDTDEPVKPVKPVDTEPVEPVKPVDTDELVPVNPVDTNEPVEPVNPVDTKPVEPVKPVDTEPVEPVKPVDTDELVPVKPVDTNEPVEPVKPVDTDEPVEPVKPVDTDEPVEPVKPVDTDEPVEPVKPVDTDEPVEPVKPVDTDEPVEPIKPVDTDEPVEPVKPVDTDEPVDPVKPVDTDMLVEPDVPDGEADISVDPLVQDESTSSCSEVIEEEMNSGSEEDVLAESQGFKLYAQKLEHELDTYLSTAPQKVPSTNTQEILNEEHKLSLLPNVSSRDRDSILVEPELTDTDDTAEASPLAAAVVTVPEIIEPEPTLCTGRDTPPGPLEQSQTTVAFNLIDEQYSHVFEELSSMKANHNYRSSEDLITTSPQETTLLVVNGNSESPSPQMSPGGSFSDTPTPQAEPEPPLATHEALRSNLIVPNKTILSNDIYTRDGGQSASPEAVSGQKSYIVDRVSQLAVGDDGGKDFLLSYQTFQKQYRVEGGPVESKASKSKKSKTTHYKIQTKTSGKSSKKKSSRETTI